MAGCRVKTEASLDSMEFTWVSGSNNRNGRGEAFASWEGTATLNRKIWVSVASARTAVILQGEVTVEPRSWSLPTQSASLRWVDSIPDDPKAWGYYEGGEPDSLLEETAQGSGPWEGTWILDEEPTITAAKMYAHNDLKSGGPEYPVDPDAHQDSIAVRKCGVSGGDSIGVHALADECGPPFPDSLDAFRDLVVAHETRHETSLNECIDAVNTDGRLAAIEAIVGTSEGAAQDSANTLW